MGSARSKSISATQAGSTSGGYSVHFQLRRRRSVSSEQSPSNGSTLRPYLLTIGRQPAARSRLLPRGAPHWLYARHQAGPAGTPAAKDSKRTGTRESPRYKAPEGETPSTLWERLTRLERSIPGQLRHLPARGGQGSVARLAPGHRGGDPLAGLRGRSRRDRPAAAIVGPARAAPPDLAAPDARDAAAVGLIIANPRRINRQSTILRSASLTLIALISLANVWSAARLIIEIVTRTSTGSAITLLVTGGGIWLTNVIVFGLWYWEFDRGGPVARALALKPYPDFQFPQMTSPQLARPTWEPTFADYFYLAFTNATAFSPTDVMPLSRWAKMLMLVQSAVSVLPVALVIARAVNILA